MRRTVRTCNGSDGEGRRDRYAIGPVIQGDKEDKAQTDMLNDTHVVWALHVFPVQQCYFSGTIFWTKNV